MSSKSIPKELHGIKFHNGRLDDEFIENNIPIGSGAFGIVTVAKNRIDEKEYAIKKLIIKDKETYDKTIRERKVWAKLDTDFFVQYRSSWVELVENNSPVFQQFLNQQHYIYGTEQIVSAGHSSGQYAVLHIQMDLCSLTLADALDQIKESFKIETRRQLIPKLAYYISSELLIEILKCIKYLHESVPQIIHRDIKPNNILIKHMRKAKFIKIGDFGGSVEHEMGMTHTRMSGTYKYMAQEVLNSRKYDTSADVYSIGVTVQELFNMDINLNNEMPEYYGRLKEITCQAMAQTPNQRPTCANWLKNRADWALDFNKVGSLIAQRIHLDQSYDIRDDFINYFLKAKYLINQ